MKFLHVADVHIGYRQYNSQQRFDDFAQAFHEVVELAKAESVDICLIAGDLFHKASIDPDTLLQAEKNLSDLTDAGIRTLAISGNHDRPRYGEQTTWLDYLEERKLLTLLESQTDGLYIVENQSYVDIEATRFIGMPWYGGSTRAVLERIVEELDDLSWDGIQYCVMMAHTAIEGQMPNMPDMLLNTDIEPLKKYVDYLALGHLHKPYKHPHDDPWVYNPGAIENNNFDEARFNEKGAYLVDIHDYRSARVEMKVIHGRPFRKLEISITRFADFPSLTDGLRDKLKDVAKKRDNDQDPVVNLILTGNLKFDRSQLKIETLREIVEQSLDCLLVRVTSHLDTLEIIGDYDDDMAVEQLERLVFADIAREHGYGEKAEQWGHYLQQTKNAVLTKESPAQIYDALVEHLSKLNETNGDG